MPPILPKQTALKPAPVQWRKARWTDAEPEVQRLLDLLPLLTPSQQQQIWFAWQHIWQGVIYTVEPDKRVQSNALKPFTNPTPKRRKLDNVPFAFTLLTQLAMVSSPVRLHWARHVLSTRQAYLQE